jgi:hypothetical protein
MTMTAVDTRFVNVGATMSDTATLELSRELFELSGWEEPKADWHGVNKDYICPKYSAGYLLRKLPSRIQDEDGTWFALMGYPNGIRPWFAYKSSLDGTMARWPNNKDIPFDLRVFEGDTPEDALCRTAIELHKEGILPISGRDL